VQRHVRRARLALPVQHRRLRRAGRLTPSVRRVPVPWW
jgi:hypothetical protein